MATFRFSIKDMKHYIAICSMQDVVIDSQTMALTRKDVRHTWALIKEAKSSMFSREGYTVADGKAQLEQPTHKIYTRYFSDLDITNACWLFEERGESPPRWFHVLGIENLNEDSEWMCFSCRLTQQSFAITQPTDEPSLTGVAPLPDGVVL